MKKAEADELGADLAQRLRGVGVGEVEHIGRGEHAADVEVGDHFLRDSSTTARRLVDSAHDFPPDIGGCLDRTVSRSFHRRVQSQCLSLHVP